MPLYVLPTYPDLLRSVFWDDFITSLYNNRTWAVTGTGSLTSTSESGGRILVRGNTNSSYTVNLGNIGNFTVAGNAHIVWRAKMIPSTGSSGIVECGFQASTNPTLNYIRWQYSPSSAITKFRCQTTSEGSHTTTDSGIAGDNNDHEFRIECHTGVVLFYLDGSLRATHTTDIPTGQLQPFINATGSSAIVSDINADFVWAIGDRV